MRLYQHSARCPVALRLFLDCNPSYWCFIPLLWDDVPVPDSNSSQNNADMDLEVTHAMGGNISDDRAVTYLLNRVPLPPAAYVFSYQQRQKQRSFFENFLSYEEQSLPYIAVDMYKVHVVTVCKWIQVE